MKKIYKKYLLNIEKSPAACQGHFENNPILPGAFILEHVCQAVTQKYTNFVLQKIKRAKFCHQLSPGQKLKISLQQIGTQEIKFSCHDSHEKKIAVGVILGVVMGNQEQIIT